MFDELELLRSRARAALSRGDLEGALEALLLAAGQAHIEGPKYVAVLRSLDEVLFRRDDPRGALTVRAYLASVGAARSSQTDELLRVVPAVDRAPVLAAQGKTEEAAWEMESAGRLAAAAIYREKAADWSGAGHLWSRLAHATERGDDPYVAALVRFNLARCAKQCSDAGEARRAIVASVRLLEEAADQFESSGQRERAFDCFQVLVQIGREGGAFEDALEGFVNSIRILREDHLKSDFALALYDEAIGAATECGETRAAATLARQAAEFARAQELRGPAAQYALRHANLWQMVAEEQQGRSASPDAIESALLAAIAAFNEIGRYGRVRELYRQLSLIDLGAARQAHYARAAGRYEHVGDEPVEAVPRAASAPKQHPVHGFVWHVDVLEWERKGNAAEACADVLLDVRQESLIRRRAILARLTALDVERPHDEAGVEATRLRVRLAEQLGQLGLYAMLSPLEALFDEPDRRVKLAVLQALQTLYYKRSFATIRRALREEGDAAIVDKAAKAMVALSFPHAVDPISRILREAAQPAVRTAALRALARIDTAEAAAIVLGIIEHGAQADRTAALAAVRETCGAKFAELARAALPTAKPASRAILREVLATRGLDAGVAP